MAYPQGFIQELKMRSPVQDVIGRYVELKRAGRNLVGRCPFHSEKTPSFTVFEDNFHCFGCGAGGDVITFAMRIENLDYRDAVQFLADRCGMTVPQDEKRYSNIEKPKLSRERAFSMNKAAARIFYENLISSEGQEARDYLAKRELSAATIKRFGLGFAKNEFYDLHNKLTALGYTTEEIKENFLCGISQKSGKPFDMFRNRIMFPIIDTSGNVIAFGGRVMDDSKPKYLNSSDTVIFRKGKQLFALNYAKDVLLGNVQSELVKPREIILCEGYMDVIAMHQAGFTNAVATLGTAITSEHARVVSRYAKTAFLAYDSDDAGKKAADKAMTLLNEVGVDTKIIRMLDAKDPDEYIKKFGAQSYAKLLSGSIGQIDFKLNGVLSKYNLSIPDEKLRAVDECCKVIASIYSEVKQDIYIQRLSQITDVKVESIRSTINRDRKKSASKAAANRRADTEKKTMHFDDRVNPEAIANPVAVEIEERILGILLLMPEEYARCDSLSEDDFVTKFSARVFRELSLLYNQNITDFSQFNEIFTPEEMSRIFDMRHRRSELTANGTQALNEQIAALKREKSRVINSKGSISSDDDLMNLISKARKDKGLN
ncbi:MAG: DNA primase [Ruminococcaceae bacterium]|nr:DNA primase [Oscillospiraceae bacterium]